MGWPTYIHVFCDIHMLLHFFHRPSPKSVNSLLLIFNCPTFRTFSCPVASPLGGHFPRFQWGDLQSPVAMKEFLNHIIWWLGYIRYVTMLVVCWKSLSERWKVKRLIRLPRFGSSSLTDPTSHQFRWSNWETLERDSPQLGRNKPSKNPSMDAIATSEKTRIFNFLPKQTTKKNTPWKQP